ncbi:hypothetical protein SRB5_63010 [Streptomyces sp. RB5]|uniref:Uncharacterized protein n=1 Tax=Streptomyces smaragdinus TaxID=2585196 RepID=A0A7K0CRM5_9ACTN|nr:hypothetical protein [Streptomyces smaragdinus]MQY16109.1 hypothetical protein [Streptomyces smaragdinus]
MPLLAPRAPAPALRSVVAALSSPAVLGARTAALSRSQGPLVPERPLPVHIMDKVGEAGGPPSTRPGGWRFLLRGADQSVRAAAETMLTADGWAFSHVVQGPYVDATERALRQAESLPGLFQTRLLSIPELYMLTLWLHGDTTADGLTGHPAPDDLLVPLAPAPPGIAAHRPHRVADLLPRLTLRLSSPSLLPTTA